MLDIVCMVVIQMFRLCFIGSTRVQRFSWSSWGSLWYWSDICDVFNTFTTPGAKSLVPRSLYFVYI